MKNRIIYLIISGIAFVNLISCNTDAEGTLYSLSDKQELSSASTLMSSEVVQEDNGMVKVPVYRGKADGEYSTTIKLEGAGEDSPFSLKSDKITFQAGQNIAYAELLFGDLDQLEPVALYEMSLSLIDSEQVSPSGVETLDLKIRRKLTWETLGSGVYSSDFFDASWEQTIEKSKEGEVYRLPDRIETGVYFIFSVEPDNSINFGKQETGYVHSSYGMVSFGPSLAGSAKEGNEFIFVGKYTVSAGSFGTFADTFTLE